VCALLGRLHETGYAVPMQDMGKEYEILEERNEGKIPLKAKCTLEGNALKL
jgi:hypothetical protein